MPRRSITGILRDSYSTVSSVSSGTIKVFLKANCFNHAAALSFFTLLSMIPFIILLIAASGYIAVALGPQFGSIDGLIDIILNAIHRFNVFPDESLRENLNQVIRARGAIGIFGLLIMLLAASMVFTALENSIDAIFEIRDSRKLLLSKLLFSIFFSALGFILFVLHYLMTIFDSIVMAAEGVTLDQWLKANPLFDFFLTFVPIPAGFLIVIHYFSSVKVRLLPSLSGACFFLFLWEIARSFYAYYVQEIAKFNILYGSLASPIVLILWIFYSANILLLSISFVKVLNERSERRDAEALAPW
ncbi:MAG: YihY/virulence factor BrkB family protein [Deltaproteobacteria bacterium]|nr:YihY/virulence factor BrkB family protein [Deltaproteobacteria bacterium]